MLYVYSFIGVLPDNSIAFIGECNFETYTTTFRGHYSRSSSVAGGTQLDFLLSIIQDPGSDAAEQALGVPPEPLEWEELPPSQRSLNPDDTPPEILVLVSYITLDMAIPPEWAGRDDVDVCGFTSLGWGDCAPLSQSVGGRMPDISLPVVQGSPTEVWLTDADSFFGEEFAQIATISSTSLSNFALNLT